MAITGDHDGIPHDSPDMIVPPNEASPQRTFGEHLQHIRRAFTTKDGLVGDYDYGILSLPSENWRWLGEEEKKLIESLQHSCSNRIFLS